MSDLVARALERADKCDTVFVKFLSPNDTGLTGGHQCGIYIQKQCVPLIFERQFERGLNQDRWADIVWNEEELTRSRFIYYGQGTRNEYRITNFGRGFQLLKPDRTGDLVVICRESWEKYWAYTFSTEEEIEEVLDAWQLPPTGTDKLVKGGSPHKPTEDELIIRVISEFGGEFPDTTTMARSAERLDLTYVGDTMRSDPDGTVLRWTDVEYRLFRKVEEQYYSYVLERPMKSLDEFVRTGLEITNRRKSRAGKSLEKHLASIFDAFDLQYTAQAVTEGNKKPDFIFPSAAAYHDPTFPAESLVFLGSKTTCKDRWRQVLNEADRIPHKYLFTLQQGVSPAQLDEMRAEDLTLVVPKPLHRTYPKGGDIITLSDFIDIASEVRSA